MTNELKRMLFEYLAAAYPCGIICEVPFNKKEQKLQGIIGTDLNDIRLIFEKDDDLVCECYLSEVKPYLRPMSSMTEEEKEELRSEFGADIRDEDNGRHTEEYGYVIVYHKFKDESWYIPFEAIDWLNAHHFDYRGLIEDGLALEAPEGMYKLKQ